ncbi:DUF4402 domain-containing protein [Glaciecola sp. 1036]|uniref:DUF4402 domain-containing protein n=1 Tax=Alteromonadaceae TaxID=72275 RepID=UPI003D001621
MTWKIRLCYLLITSLLAICSFVSHGQEIIEVTPLSFGSVAVLDNSSVGHIEVDSLGNISISTNFAVLEPPQYGEFRLVDYPVNANLFVTGGIVQAQTTSDAFSPEQFTLTAVNTVSVINIGSDGTALLRVGGRLETSGSGSLVFGDTTYSCRLVITVNY